MAKTSKKTPPPPPQKPQGKSGKKRTPTSAFDGAAGKDVYEPEKVIGQRMAKGGITQFNVKWVGWEAKHNTWEPIENLAECEDMIAAFKEREKQRNAEIEAVAEAKRVEKEAAAATAATKAAADLAASRLASTINGVVRDAVHGSGDAASSPHGNDDAPSQAGVASKASKRSAPIWRAYDQTGAPPGKTCCTLRKANGEICGEELALKSAPTNLWNHAMYKHPEEYINLKPPTDTLNLVIDPQTKMNALPAKHRDQVHKAVARWIVKTKRPFSICESAEFHDLFNVAMRGAYTPPCHKIVKSNVLLLSGEGQKKLFDVNTSLRAQGIKVAMAGDIWSDRGVSLLGLCEYYISADWEIVALVLAASPFNERHTAENICEKTRAACIKAGLSNDLVSSIFFPVSDNAANMIAAWTGFGRSPCAVHTGQLSAEVFLDHEEIEPTRTKCRGMTTHFSFCTGIDGLGALHGCQRECRLPEHHPVKDIGTRWSSGHDQMEFFRQQQRALQLYDVNCARKAGDAYRQHQMGLVNWRINLEGVAVLQPIADWTQHMEGTKYPTLALVLPTVYGLIEGMSPTAPLILSFQGQAEYELTPEEMHPGVLKARTAMYDDWVRRWITNLAPEVKRTYAIASLLHPCFKTYDFVDNMELIPASDKAWALRELRMEWATVWKQRPTPAPAPAPTPAGPSDAAAADPAADPHAGSGWEDHHTRAGRPDAAAAAPVAAAAAAVATDDAAERPTKHRKVSLGGLLGGRIKKEAAKPAPPTALDELEQYLADTEEPTIDVKVLLWWKEKEAKWPNLAKMVKQYFAAPASSAGVERVFSAAGKMHGDLSKSAKDTTLEHSLFAAFNTD